MSNSSNITRTKGWLALSPLFVFLGVYLLSSLIAQDFYKIPVASAFLAASVYAVAITKGGKVSGRISIFSEGAANKNVLLMIWIFVLAGAFAATAEAIGSIEATVNFALRILPGKLIFAGLFFAACFISMAIGTSVGTVVALVPIAAGIASQTGIPIPMVTAIIVGGAFFGDNLSFISDTTIAATNTQGCQMKDKFYANIKIVAPAAVIVAVIYIFLGLSVNVTPTYRPLDWLLMLPYLLVIVLAVSGVNVLTVLTLGIGVNGLIGFFKGSLSWTGYLSSVGEGIAGMGDLIIVTMLAGGMLEVIRYNGGISFIISGLTKHIKTRRGALLSIAALVSFTNFCTANNTIAIITSGGIAKDITDKFSLEPRQTASILDTFSCFVQGIIPYGAQLLMASALAGVSALSIIGYLYYPFILGIVALLFIFLQTSKTTKA